MGIITTRSQHLFRKN